MTLKSAAGRALLLVLLLQAAVYYAIASRGDIIPQASPLSEFPPAAGAWQTVREFPMEKDVQEVLRADDTLNRIYTNGPETASLFVAFFKTQRYGQAPHSPKNCLPGAGWSPSRDRKLLIDVPGRPEPIQVNDYVIQKGNERSVVLYWYQSHNRAIAGEIEAKIWLVADAIRHRRSDTALVRVMVPVRENDVETAEKTAIAFTRATYPELMRQLPQ
jgi:EpsI family protein